MLTIGDLAPAPVVFDTGASGNVLGIAFAQSANLPHMEATTIGSPAGGGQLEGYQSIVAKARLGNAELRDVPVAIVPMRLPRAVGIFGPGSFSGRLVEIDLAHSEVRIVGKSPASIPKDASSPYSEGLPGITVQLPGMTALAHIDTGSNATLSMPRAFADKLPLDAPPHVIGKARLPGGEEREILGARLKGVVHAGALVLENPDIIFLDGLQRVNIGVSALKDVIVVLDPAGKRGWIVKRPSQLRARS